MGFCCVPGCAASSKRRRSKTDAEYVSFFTIPRKPLSRYRSFIHAIGRDNKWKPSVHSRVCSRHFVHGRKSDVPESKSYLPNLNLPRKTKQVKVARRSIIYKAELVLGKQNKLLLAMLAAKADLASFTDQAPCEDRDDGNDGNEEQIPNNYTVDTLAKRLEELTTELTAAKANIANLTAEIESYQQRQFSLDRFKDNDRAVNFYTGFPNYSALLAFYNFVEPKAKRLQYWRNSSTKSKSQLYQTTERNKPGPKRNCSKFEELFMVLVRLRVGLFVEDISDRFGISCSKFSRIFTTWINCLYYELKLLFPFPTQTQIRETLPAEFAQYPTTRVIIDCTEIFVETPTSLLVQSQTWSNYKHHNTLKALVAISPNGAVTFVSELYGGRISDKEITMKSGLCEMLDDGDNVMADRGFEIQSLLPTGVHLNIPPFKGSRAQLTASEVKDTMDIASVRIHVERAIGRIKNYHVLDGGLPLTLAKVADQIFTVCAYLTNFQPPLLSPKKWKKQ